MNSVVSPNGRQLVVARSLTHLDLLLSANSEDWKPRITALQDLEQLVSDGLQRDGYDAFSEAIAAPLHSLSSSLTVQVTDLRSEIVRQCAHTLSFLSLHLPAAFSKCACKVFPAVLRVASGTNGVIRSYAAAAAEDVVLHVHSAPLLLELLAEINGSKNKTAVALCIHLLAVALHNWSTRFLRKAAAGIEESAVSSLSAADATTRTTAAKCLLLFFDHFPARQKAVLASLDARAVRLLNESRREHAAALNVSAGGGRTRNDSVTSVEGFAGDDGAMEAEEEKRPASRNSIVRAASPASAAASAASPAPGGDRVRYSYGQRVDVVEALTARSDVDDSTSGVALLGRKGTVISHSQREGRTGEWVGVRLEAAEEADGEDEPAAERRGQQVVYVRPQTLRKEGWRVTRMRAPTIDTSQLLKTPSASSQSPQSLSPFPSSSSLPPSPAPSSASSHVTPSSGRSASSSTRMTPSPVPPQHKSQSSASSAASSRPSTASPPTAKLTAPPGGSRASTSPTPRLPSTSGAPMSRTSVLPSSRIPLPPSRIPSRVQSRIQSRIHSRSNSGQWAQPVSLPSSPMLSVAASASSQPTQPAFSLSQPITASSASPSSGSQRSGDAADLPTLLAAHRQHILAVSEHLSTIKSCLAAYGSTAAHGDGDGARAQSAAAVAVPAQYSDSMVRALSEHLTKTTRMLEIFIDAKKRVIRQ